MVTTLQTKAFLCLNNIIEALTIEDLGGEQALFEVWKNLGQFTLTSNDQLEHVLEASTSAMRATTQKLAKSSPQNLLRLSLGHYISFYHIPVINHLWCPKTNRLIKVLILDILGANSNQF